MWREKDDLLRTVPGVGEQLSLTLLAHLPELGTLDRRQVAAWWEWLPSQGQWHHAWQTARLGRALPDPSPVHGNAAATRFNPAPGLLQRLLAAGKPKKVALVACMRKLLVILNSMLKQRSPWLHWRPGRATP